MYALIIFFWGDRFFFSKKLSIEYICKEQNFLGFQVIKIINEIQQTQYFKHAIVMFLSFDTE